MNSACSSLPNWPISAHKALFTCVVYTKQEYQSSPSFLHTVCIYILTSLSILSCLPVCLSVYLSVCLSICLSVCLSICLSACPSVCLSDLLLDCRFVLIFSSNDKIYLLTILFIYYLSYVYLDFLNISLHENLFYPGRLIV